MPKTNLLKTLNRFQKEKQSTSLQITFDSLEITNYRNGIFYNQQEKHQPLVHVQKTQNGPVVKIELVDNPIFRFSFQITIPKIAILSCNSL